MAPDGCQLAGAVEAGGHDKVLGAEGEEATAHDAGQAGPADEGKDDGDAEVDAQGRPVGGQRCGQPHPERDGGNGADEFDDALDEIVGCASVEAGDAAEEDAEEEAEEDAEKADRHRDARAVDHAAQEVAPHAVGAEEVDGHLGIGRADQVEVRFPQAPHFVWFTANKKADVDDLLFVDHESPLEGFGIDFDFIAVDIGIPTQPLLGLAEKVQALGRRPSVVGADYARAGGREKLNEDGDGVDDQRNDSAHHCHAMFAELPPHQLPLGCDGDAALYFNLRCSRGDGFRGQRFGISYGHR